jgi:hypothetical protein
VPAISALRPSALQPSQPLHDATRTLFGSPGGIYFKEFSYFGGINVAGFLLGVSLLVLGIFLLSPAIHLDVDAHVETLANQAQQQTELAEAPPPLLVSQSFDAAALSRMDATPKLLHAKARAISFQEPRQTLSPSHPVSESESSKIVLHTFQQRAT